MTKSHYENYQQKEFNKLMNLRLLPNYYIRIGIWLFAVCFIILLLIKFSVLESETVHFISREGILISLLFISVAREKVEDELIVRLRSQAFAIAFIWGVVYSLVSPYADILVGYFRGSGEMVLKDLGAYRLLVTMLLAQIGFFRLLKHRS